MARIELRADLDTVVARMVIPKVNQLAAEVAREGRDRAPDAKVWISRDDQRVRPAHHEAHGQTIPANLRYKLPRQMLVRGHGYRTTSGFDLGREPRDRALPPDQRDGCRCISVDIPGLIARKIHETPAVATATRAQAQVEVRFLRIVESEHGTSQDDAARFLGGAVDAVAARLRSASTRRA